MAQRERVAEAERRLEFSEGLPADSKTAPKGNRSPKRKDHKSGNESS